MENHRENGSKAKKSRKQLVLYLFIIVVMLYLIIFDNYGLIKRFSTQSLNEQKRAAILDELKAKDSLKKAIQKVEFDTNEMERVAREKYGMIKPGERVMILD